MTDLKIVLKEELAYLFILTSFGFLYNLKLQLAKQVTHNKL